MNYSYKYYVGIDVSKAKLDIILMASDNSIVEQCIIENAAGAWKQLLDHWFKRELIDANQALFCLEPTGHYSNITVAALLNAGMNVWMANPSDIRNSIGMQRGKNDRIDACRIAEYACRFADKARRVLPNELQRQQLQQLLSQREMLVNDRAKYITQLVDYKGRIDQLAYKMITKINRSLIHQLNKAIESLEKKLEAMINDIAELKQQYQLLQTIPGVGKVLAQTMIVLTNGFTRFDNPKALACHAGVAPFEYKSGSSIKGRNKVSFRSNKRLKALLHLAALSVIRTKSELAAYYKRKVAEGKNKMSVLNAIRNKIIYRIFAVLKRNSEYRLELS